MAWGGNDNAVERWIKQLEENDPKLISLHILSFRRISTQELTQIFKAMARNTTLKEFYCSGHTLDRDAVEQLSETLTLNDTLSFLNVGNASFGQDPDLFGLLCEGLAVNEGLLTLDFENKGLNKKSLALLLDSIKGHPTIQHIALGRNGIDDDDMVAISQWLSYHQQVEGKKEGYGLKSIKLEMNDIGPIGANLLATALEKQQSGNNNDSPRLCVASFVEEIDISENPLLEGAATLAKQLLQSMPSLQTLKMSNVCTPKKTEGELKLPPPALDTMEYERELELKNEAALVKASVFGNELFKAISQGLKQHQHMKTLWVDHNGIESTGLSGLDNLIQSLQEIHLRENRINDEGAAYLSQCPSLTYIELGENLMGVDGLVTLLNASSNKLQRLGLFNNQVHHFGDDAIPRFETSQVKQLDLGGNGITLKDASMMVNMLLDQGLPNLTLLELGGNAEDKDMDAWEDLFKTLKEERSQLQVAWKRLAKEMDSSKPPI